MNKLIPFQPVYSEAALIPFFVVICLDYHDKNLPAQEELLDLLSSGYASLAILNFVFTTPVRWLFCKYFYLKS